MDLNLLFICCHDYPSVTSVGATVVPTRTDLDPQIGDPDMIILNEIRGVSGENNPSILQDIAPVSGFEGLDGILFHQ